MKNVLLCLSSCCLMLACVPSLAAADQTSLLAEIMDQPGSWNQMCGLPPPLPFNAPVPVATGSLAHRDFNLGTVETKKLQDARLQVIGDLSQALQRMDLAIPPTPRQLEPQNADSRRSGMQLDWLNPLHLQVIQALNAIEVLPEMLRLENQLHGFLEAVDKDPKALLPKIDFDIFHFIKEGEDISHRPNNYWRTVEYKRDLATVNCRVAQRELLGTMMLLLRREGVQGLDERFAAEHKAAFQAEISNMERRLAEIKKRHPEPEKEPTEEASVYIGRMEAEMISLKSGRTPVSVNVPYSPALRAEIRTTVETFLKTVPPEQRKGAAAMPKVP